MAFFAAILWLSSSARADVPDGFVSAEGPEDCVKVILRDAGFMQVELETELKYTLTEEESSRLQAVLGGARSHARFKTYYFDDAAFSLDSRHLNLRLRMNGSEEHKTVCLKAKPGIKIPKNGLPTKSKWEAEHDIAPELAERLIAGQSSWLEISPVRQALKDLGLPEETLRWVRSFGFVETFRSRVSVEGYPDFLFDTFTLNGQEPRFRELEIEAPPEQVARVHQHILSLMTAHQIEYRPESLSKRSRLLQQVKPQ